MSWLQSDNKSESFSQKVLISSLSNFHVFGTQKNVLEGHSFVPNPQNLESCFHQDELEHPYLESVEFISGNVLTEKRITNVRTSIAPIKWENGEIRKTAIQNKSKTAWVDYRQK